MTASSMSEQIAATLDHLALSIYEDNKKKGFWPAEHERGSETVQIFADFIANGGTIMATRDEPARNIGEALMLAVTELSEALEIYRKGGLLAESNVLPGHCHFTEEIADTIIRLLDLAGGLDLSLGETLMKKLEYNRTRPPKHGKKF